ncbi:gamma-glutamyltransferase family protein [Planctomycetota bacterium]
MKYCQGSRILVIVIFALFLCLFAATVNAEEDLLDIIGTFKSYGHLYNAKNVESMRPRIMGTNGVVSTGHYLATIAGIEAFKKGGNAFDAGVTAAMALKVTKMGFAGWNGVAPLILYSAKEGQVLTRIGAGSAPAKATLDYFLKQGKTQINTALIPADVDVWLACLDRFGTFSFEEAVQPALEIAENGYHLYKMQKWLLDEHKEGILKWPYNTEFWFQMGVGKHRVGDIMVNKDLGKLIRYMISAEGKALLDGGTRSDAIRAARDAFYKGEPAWAVDKLYKEHNGLVTYEDMANYKGRWMAPVHTTYRGYDVYSCHAWSQGPRMTLWLNMLENFDLKTLGYNTPEYIHLISQVINLGMSDCHKYLGDPDVVEIPKALFSKEYAGKRIKLIDNKRAFQDMPPWGDPSRMLNVAPDSPTKFSMKDNLKLFEVTQAEANEKIFFDTTSLNVIDAEGNIFSMTESDGHMTTPMIPGWGFGLSARMWQFNLDPDLANVIAPHKRPRNTNNPHIVMKDGKPFMGLSTPGDDQQAQALLQVLLNVVEWGMSPEEALDQPRFGSYNFPGTGSETNTHPAQLNLEDRIPKETAEALRAIGHDVKSWGLWNWRACAPTVTYRDPETGTLRAAGDVRRETYTLGY